MNFTNNFTYANMVLILIHELRSDLMKKIFISGRIPEIAHEMLSKEFEVSMHDDITLLSKDQIIEEIGRAHV